MAIKYVCDICGKEHNRVGVIQGQAPVDWATISIMLPVKPYGPFKPGELPKHYSPMAYQGPQVSIVCSQACAEKALDEAKGLLRPAFEKLQ